MSGPGEDDVAGGTGSHTTPVAAGERDAALVPDGAAKASLH